MRPSDIALEEREGGKVFYPTCCIIGISYLHLGHNQKLFVMCNSIQPIPVGTVVQFKIWDTEKDGQGIGVILGSKPRLRHETIYRVHFKRFPELVYQKGDPTELTISQSDIKEVLETGSRLCSVTHKPMNDGYVWDNGIHYCCDDKDVMIKEITEDLNVQDSFWDEVDKKRILGAEDIIDEYFEVCDENNLDFYYTEWDLEESVREGQGWFLMNNEDDDRDIFGVFDSGLLERAFEAIDKDSDLIGYDDELTSERMEEISDTEGAEDIECESCGHVNTHDTEEFGFCVTCLEHIV